MSNKSPIDFLQLFLTDEMLLMIVQQTNLFAQQYNGSHELRRQSRSQLRRQSRSQQWSRFLHDVQELKRFLVIMLVMGLVDYSRVEDAWVTSWPFATSTFSSIMS